MSKKIMNKLIKDTGSELRCSACGELKYYCYFSISLSQSRRLCLDGHRRETTCKSCKAAKFQRADDRKKLLYPAQKRAKAKGIPCTITIDDIIIPEFCPILGMPLARARGIGCARSNSPSLDRINPLLGYIPGNVAVISRRANTMKTDASSDELLAFARNIERYLAQGNDLSSVSRPYRNQGAGRIDVIGSHTETPPD